MLATPRPRGDIPMSCLWRSDKDLMDRLGGTHIKYRGEIVYAEFGHYPDPETKKEVSGLILFDPLGSGKTIAMISPDDPDLDVSSFELGYVNTESERRDVKPDVIYLTRSPQKQWKQGFMPQRIRANAVDGSKYTSSWSIPSIFSSLCGDYPSYELYKDLRARKDPPDKIALSRQVAVKTELSGVTLVYIDCKNVAYISGQKVVLKDDNLKWIYERVLRGVFGENYEINT